METNKDQLQRSQSGTGSAEQTGSNRDDQKNPLTNLSSGEKQDIASQIGVQDNSITSIDEMGDLSGRDDASGGSGDRMEGEHTNERTDR